MKRLFLFNLFFCLLFGTAVSQNIDNTASFRNTTSASYIRFHYSNDFFTATDYYYTQGINIEFAHPVIRKFPLSKILLRLPESAKKYGFSVEYIGNTPLSIRNAGISYNDRPFSSYIGLKSFCISQDSLRKLKFSSSVYIGAIGPVAFGETTQTSIHRWINDVVPMGWQHQIQNDLVLNYEITHEKQLLQLRENFWLSSYIKLRAGTLSDKAQLGFTLITGRTNYPFSPVASRNNKFLFHFYSQPLVNFIGYDASLQGGMFNRSSPYKIPGNQISRITFQANAGIIASFKKLYAEYHQSFLTKEFNSGKYHRWGGICLGLNF